MSSFSIKSAVSFGLTASKNNFYLFLKVFIAVAVSFIVLSLLSPLVQGLSKNQTIPTVYLFFLLTLALLVAQYVLQALIALGLIRIPLKIIDSKATSWKDLFVEKKLVIPYWIATILFSLVIILLLIVLVAIGFIFGFFLWNTIPDKNLRPLVIVLVSIPLLIFFISWNIKYKYFSYLIVDKKLGPIQSLKESSRITRGVKLKIFLFEILLMLINILGFVFLIFGLLFTIPLSLIAEAYVYRTISGKTPSQSAARKPKKAEKEKPLVVPNPK